MGHSEQMSWSRFVGRLTLTRLLTSDRSNAKEGGGVREGVRAEGRRSRGEARRVGFRVSLNSSTTSSTTTSSSSSSSSLTRPHKSARGACVHSRSGSFMCSDAHTRRCCLVHATSRRTRPESILSSIYEGTDPRQFSLNQRGPGAEEGQAPRRARPQSRMMHEMRRGPCSFRV